MITTFLNYFFFTKLNFGFFLEVGFTLRVKESKVSLYVCAAFNAFKPRNNSNAVPSLFHRTDYV